MRLFTFANLRIAALLLVLATLWLMASHQHHVTREWQKPLNVIVFPINGDASAETQAYIDNLSDTTFQDIDQWLSREAARYVIPSEKPSHTTVGAQIQSLPPEFDSEGHVISTLWWGLKLRWWAFNNTPDELSNLERVRMFVIYHQSQAGVALPHSLGLAKGLIGIIHAFADAKQTAQNNIVIAHELLHTVGANDKYNDAGYPIYPQGFANPERKPLFPQRRAEIMAGHIATSEEDSHMALSLKSVIINDYTAREINWRME